MSSNPTLVGRTSKYASAAAINEKSEKHRWIVSNAMFGIVLFLVLLGAKVAINILSYEGCATCRVYKFLYPHEFVFGLLALGSWLMLRRDQVTAHSYAAVSLILVLAGITLAIIEIVMDFVDDIFNPIDAVLTIRHILVWVIAVGLLIQGIVLVLYLRGAPKTRTRFLEYCESK